MARGDVWAVDLPLPLPAPSTSPTFLTKYVVELQGGRAFEAQRDVAVVIVSTLRRPGPARPFEVYVGQSEGFAHDSVVDGRWVWTVPRVHVRAGRHVATLSEATMGQVAEAIAVGLDLI